MGQVAGPHRRPAPGPLDAGADIDADAAPLHVPRHRRFPIFPALRPDVDARDCTLDAIRAEG